MKILLLFILLSSIPGMIIFNPKLKDEIVSRTSSYDMRLSNEFSVNGIDVSHHQGHIDWKKVKTQNIQFVIIKSTEGKNFVDKRFRYNLTHAKKNGFFVSAYHYYRVDFDPIKQFDNVRRNVPKNSLDLPFVIDLEIMNNESLRNPNTHDKFIKDLKIFEKKIHKHYGKKPIFYAGPGFYVKFLKSNFTNSLWVADYSSKKINYFKSSTWSMWQYSCTGKVKGINGNVDMNIFRGSYDDLKNL